MSVHKTTGDIKVDSVCVHQWHSLSREEQAKYYEKARQERQLHMQLYPGWSARDNYGYGTKKKKRKKERTPVEPGGTLSHTFNSTRRVTSFTRMLTMGQHKCCLNHYYHIYININLHLMQIFKYLKQFIHPLIEQFSLFKFTQWFAQYLCKYVHAQKFPTNLTNCVCSREISQN